MDLEKELTCSVGKFNFSLFEFLSFRELEGVVLSMTADRLCLDLHRTTLSTADTSRLSAYFLRLLFEGVVLMAGLTTSDVQINTPIHLPVMQGGCARIPSQCHRHYTPGHVLAGKSG
jgi:hypothetical protein